MLVLGRGIGERIRLTTPDGIVVWVSVERLGGNDCRIGIEAPPAVEIVREEVIGRDDPQ